jgi:hypothetical protein
MENEQQEPKKDQREGDRLLVGNLPFAATYEQVVEVLSKHAQILDLHLSVGTDGKNKGWAIFRVPSNQTKKMLAASVAFDRRILHFKIAE